MRKSLSLNSVNSFNSIVCVICLELLNDNIVTSPWICNHSFHTSCIKKYIQNKIKDNDQLYPYCPICRTCDKHFVIDMCSKKTPFIQKQKSGNIEAIQLVHPNRDECDIISSMNCCFPFILFSLSVCVFTIVLSFGFMLHTNT